jgi:lipoprotein NlpI
MRLHDFEGAMADVNTSINIAPSNTFALVTRARIKYSSQDYQGAMADCDKALTINKKYAPAYARRGYIGVEQSKDSAALESFGKAIELDEAQLYPRFQIWAIHCKAGKAQDATEELKAHLRSRPDTEAGSWPYQLESFLAGLNTEQNLRAMAQNLAKTPQERFDQVCEAAYYAGLKHLFAGEKDRAANLFRECVATDDKDFVEYTRARAELSQMQAR